MPRPCVGCGFEVDENEDLVVKGVSEREWVLGYDVATQQPLYEFCDPASGRVWHKPFNMPWGRYWSQAYLDGQINYPVFNVPGAWSPGSYATGVANASLLVDTPYVQIEPAVADTALRAYSARFDLYFAVADPQFCITYARLVRDLDLGGGVISTEVGVWECIANDARPKFTISDFVSGRRVKWRVQAFCIGNAPSFAVQLNGICRDEGPAIDGIAGNHLPGAGAYYG